jgi:hypothetical protein
MQPARQHTPLFRFQRFEPRLTQNHLLFTLLSHRRLGIFAEGACVAVPALSSLGHRQRSMSHQPTPAPITTGERSSMESRRHGCKPNEGRISANTRVVGSESNASSHHRCGGLEEAWTRYRARRRRAPDDSRCYGRRCAGASGSRCAICRARCLSKLYCVHRPAR